MPYVNILVHLVFGTKNNFPFLKNDIKRKIIDHIIENSHKKEIFILAINGAENHLHCLISMGKKQSIAQIANLIKGESSFWVNKNNITPAYFNWAEEYYAASISDSAKKEVKKYISNQEEHHRKKTFAEECEIFLKEYGFEVISS